MHKGKNLYSEQEAVIMGFIKELKEEFEIIKAVSYTHLRAH